jgi:hypothetical protein
VALIAHWASSCCLSGKLLQSSNCRVFVDRCFLEKRRFLVIDIIKVPQVPPVSDFGMNFADFPATFHPDGTDRLSTGKRKPLPEPRPHQIEAIENVIIAFKRLIAVNSLCLVPQVKH